MATVAEKLADSLELLKRHQDSDGAAVIHGTDTLGRTHTTRLLEAGWLKEVIKGWYIGLRPGMEGETTDWYTVYWHFVTRYCNNRFGEAWCLTPDQSLDLLSGDDKVPTQTIIRNPEGNNKPVRLLYGTGLFNLKAKMPSKVLVEPRYGLQIYSIEEAIVSVSPSYFRNSPISARTCLMMNLDEAAVFELLLNEGASTRAGRLAGALRNVGKGDVADRLLKYMRRMGYDVREEDPFVEKMPEVNIAVRSPYVARLSLMWQNMREQVLGCFPQPQTGQMGVEQVLKSVDERYVKDAYHSLSIEGYRVSDELIEKVRSGKWNPKGEDKDNQDALVARGYYQAFQAVRASVDRILHGADPAETVAREHGDWYFEMWQPMVQMELFKPSALMGYRNIPVYIRGSRHTPMSSDAVRDAMPAFFELMKQERESAVRAVLGHFMMSYIHPYVDGNGRMSRFLMNVMLCTGGYQWTVVPVERRREYMASLEKARVETDITDFARLIAELLR